MPGVNEKTIERALFWTLLVVTVLKGYTDPAAAAAHILARGKAVQP